MSANREHRIAGAVDSLIAHLVPNDPHEDDAAAQERHDNCFDLVKSILDGPASPAISSDVNHASDLIKRKLIQSNPSQALRFSNLYTRLLSLPVLGQKWAILYLLYQLADSPDPNEPLPLPPPKPPSQVPREPSRNHERGQSMTSTPVSREEEQFNDAFAPEGLKKFPPNNARKKSVDERKPEEKEKEKETETEEAESNKRQVALKSTLLADNYTDIEPSETVLLRDLPFTLQDPMVAAFAERLLVHVTRPFYDILRRWIYDGELLDPYCEFFVKEQQQTDEPKTGGSSVWEDKYEIDKGMIPSIITQDFAQKVFLIGKSLNFIRHSCGDSQWVEDYSKAASKELRYGDTATLEAWIDEAYKTTMKRLIDLMANKFHLFEHLQALKNYILLGQGDFIALLMESLAANLDRPAGAQYRHTLTAQLEHAIRGSNAQYDSPEVLRRLDARMLQLSHGDIGWDCFTLEYKVDAPVDVVVTDWGNRQYLKVFNFLWRIKRVEFALASTWRKCMTGSRGVLQNSDPVVVQTWKSTRGVLAEMIHFIGQLQYYILFEVIESSWNELQKRIHREGCTLDDLIKAHTRYLNDITHKGLLGARRSVRHVETATGEDDRGSYLAQLGDLLRAMLSYRDSVDGLYSWSVSDFTRRQEADVMRISTRAPRHQKKASTPGPDGDDDNHAVASEFPVLQERLRHLGSSFRSRLQILLGDLAYQPDVDMRFLGVAMNFNDVYQPSRRKTKTTSTASANTSRA
ncbi:Spindle pole body component alp6 [Colletotrichum sp. SAR 10_70]|nr:Spindle pole body component alp6 [Colletotrichum sp. SAR 10_71]KAI8181717.1 Spindle pole body component alp6 [Colletotrichum sp. SAR 10_70]